MALTKVDDQTPSVPIVRLDASRITRRLVIVVAVFIHAMLGLRESLKADLSFDDTES